MSWQFIGALMPSPPAGPSAAAPSGSNKGPQQHRPQPFLRRNRGPTDRRIQNRKIARQTRQGLIHDGADRVDRLAGWNLALDGVEETDELLMPVALHVAADHRAVEDVHRGKQRRRAVPLIVVGHGSGATLLQRQSGLGAVEHLNLALFVDRQDNGVGGRIDIEPDDVAQFVDEARVVGTV